ncbi:MAG: hypothetical protein ACD_79C00015G0002 [uncultured bacterium]|nr:MAG: hypothetical protein ACD_79C00015G0002 [uncultured bacterium]
MSITAGTIQYKLGTFPVTGCGFSYSESELDTALAGPVAKVVFDDSGKADIQSLLASLTETDFEKTEVERILSSTKQPEDWRVGEALAESYLVHQKDCFFPWPDGRDERKNGSSLPGADLVGFQQNGADVFFAFGEVKTSTENKYPPGAMHGRTGLKQQLEDLKENTPIKDDLVKYLGYRATSASWKLSYQNAAKKYIQSKTNIRVFGFLVRDVEPNKDDLRVRVEKLSQNSHSDMIIELLALYLPVKSISALSIKVVKIKNGGAA